MRAPAIGLFLLCATPLGARTIHVPTDEPTIQSGVDAAGDGDVVLVAPGEYREAIVLSKGAITLASRFLESGDPEDARRTILRSPRGSSFIVKVEPGVEPSTRIVGFTIRDGEDGISCHAEIEVSGNVFVNNKDAIDYEGGGGVCRDNLFEGNRDDGVDLDRDCAVLVENNVIRNNEDDGIEIRLHEYSGPELEIVIRGNVISGNGEDGIQLIDYPDVSDRSFLIERNVFENNAMAAIGCMSDGNTKEDYEAADIPEPIFLVNNTFVGNHYGVTGGDNMLVLNNVFHSTRKTALKKVDGDSVVAHVLFWKNGRDHDQSRIDGSLIVSEDPRLDGEFHPREGSPCIDAGVATFGREGERRFETAPGSFTGAAPDLGAFEFAASEATEPAAE